MARIKKSENQQTTDKNIWNKKGNHSVEITSCIIVVTAVFVRSSVMSIQKVGKKKM